MSVLSLVEMYFIHTSNLKVGLNWMAWMYFRPPLVPLGRPAADACFSSPLPLVFIDQTDARYDDMIGLHSILLLLQRGLRQLQTLPHTAGKKHHLPGLRQQMPIFSADSAKLAGFTKEWYLWGQT